MACPSVSAVGCESGISGGALHVDGPSARGLIVMNMSTATWLEHSFRSLPSPTQSKTPMSSAPITGAGTADAATLMTYKS